MSGLPPAHPYPDDQPHEDALARRVRELEVVFEPPYTDLLRQAKHAEGTCMQCDAERALVAKSP